MRGRNTNIYTGNTAARAGGIRYNPETGRVVAGRGGGAGNIHTGNGVAGGARTVVDTDTGRVTNQAGAAGRTDGGATAAGGFNSSGERGNASGAGYVHYDRYSGDISRSGAANVNGNIYAGKDGNVYRYDKDNGWQSVTGGGRGNATTGTPATWPGPDRNVANRPDLNRSDTGRQTYGPSDPSLDRERNACDRGFERDVMSGGGFNRPGTSRPAFDRGSYRSGMRGRMGGFRGRGLRR